MLIVTIAQLAVPGELLGLASANLLMSRFAAQSVLLGAALTRYVNRGIGGAVGSAG